MPFVSITRLRIRTPEFVDRFAEAVPGVYAQAADAPGNLAMDLLAEANATFWTRTVWTDRAAMRSYMTSGDHGDVMPLLRDWCDEAHVAHWEQADEELPTWERGTPPHRGGGPRLGRRQPEPGPGDPGRRPAGRRLSTPLRPTPSTTVVPRGPVQ